MNEILTVSPSNRYNNNEMKNKNVAEQQGEARASKNKWKNFLMELIIYER